MFLNKRARRRKKIAKALERQARKLRAKGISVNIESLRSEYLAQHRVTTESDLDDDDIQIDVVGEDSDDEPEDCSINRPRSPSPRNTIPNTDFTQTIGDFLHHQQTKQTRNPFSIESLLYNHS